MNFPPESVEGRYVEKLMDGRAVLIERADVQLLSHFHFLKFHSITRLHCDWVRLIKECPVIMPPIAPATEADPIYEPISSAVNGVTHLLFDPRLEKAKRETSKSVRNKYPMAPFRWGQTIAGTPMPKPITLNAIQQALAGVTRNPAGSEAPELSELMLARWSDWIRQRPQFQAQNRPPDPAPH
jgi:hypothetical protein